MDVEQRGRELLVAEYKARGELVHAMNIEKGGLSVMYAAEIAAIIAALTPPEGWVELSHVEDILLQAETLASSGGADAESVVEWISESLLPAESLLPSRREVKP